jgi:hypothetical protein
VDPYDFDARTPLPCHVSTPWCTVWGLIESISKMSISERWSGGNVVLPSPACSQNELCQPDPLLIFARVS